MLLYLPLSTVRIIFPISACTACGNEPVDRLVEVVVARMGTFVVTVEVVIFEPAKLTGWFLEVCKIEVGWFAVDGRSGNDSCVCKVRLNALPLDALLMLPPPDSNCCC